MHMIKHGGLLQFKVTSHAIDVLFTAINILFQKNFRRTMVVSSSGKSIKKYYYLSTFIYNCNLTNVCIILIFLTPQLLIFAYIYYYYTTEAIVINRFLVERSCKTT